MQLRRSFHGMAVQVGDWHRVAMTVDDGPALLFPTDDANVARLHA